MTEKERLIELLMEVGIIEKACYLNFQKEVVNCKLCFAERVADYLIANGAKLSATPCDFCEYGDKENYLYETPCNMCMAKAKEE